MLHEATWSPANDLVSRLLAERSEVVLDRFAGLIERLGPSERERADALVREMDRADFLAAHLLARVAIAEVLDAPAASVEIAQRCPTCGGEHGPPQVLGHPGIRVGWSHTRGYVAASAGRVPVAVDVEATDRLVVTDAVARTALSAEELAQLAYADDPARYFLRQWVRKECLIKLGRFELDALPTVNLADLQLPASDETITRRAWGDLRLLEWQAEDGRIVGAAVTGPVARSR